MDRWTRSSSSVRRASDRRREVAGRSGQRPAEKSAGRLGEVPARETIEGLPVRHPRTLFVPRAGHGTWGPLYVASLAPYVLRYRGEVDVVLASWAYPDGFAGVVLARLLGVPAVVKLHGGGIHLEDNAPGLKGVMTFPRTPPSRALLE